MNVITSFISVISKLVDIDEFMTIVVKMWTVKKSMFTPAEPSKKTISRAVVRIFKLLLNLLSFC